nr:hypothetical protein [Tanacetum cinerariifolium]
MKAICNLDVYMDSKAPKYSSPTKEVSQGKKPRARSGLKRKQSSKHTSESIIEASKSQSGHSKKETKSSSAMDTSPSHPSPPILVVGEIHKEAQQAAGGPTSLGDTSEDRAHPQLSSDVSKEEENAKNDKDTKDTLVPPPSPKLAQLQELMAQVHLLQSQKKELEQAKVIAEAEVALMKAKPSYLDINHPTKLLNIQWELPAEFLDLPHLASLVQEKLKTLDSILGLLKTVTHTLNKFGTLVENASGATTTGVSSADKAIASPAEGEKDADINLKN